MYVSWSTSERERERSMTRFRDGTTTEREEQARGRTWVGPVAKELIDRGNTAGRQQESRSELKGKTRTGRGGKRGKKTVMH